MRLLRFSVSILRCVVKSNSTNDATALNSVAVSNTEVSVCLKSPADSSNNLNRKNPSETFSDFWQERNIFSIIVNILACMLHYVETKADCVLCFAAWWQTRLFSFTYRTIFSFSFSSNLVSDLNWHPRRTLLYFLMHASVFKDIPISVMA